MTQKLSITSWTTSCKIAAVNAWIFFRDLMSFEVLTTLNRDAIHIVLCKIIRRSGFGMLSVMLVILLTELGISLSGVGLMFTFILLGDAATSIMLTTYADKLGRKYTLIVGSVLAIATGTTFTFSSNFWVLLISAICGVISPSGSEVGPFTAIETSSLSQVTREYDRTKVMAWYNLFGCFASAIGAISCGFIIKSLTSTAQNFSLLTACRVVMVIYTTLQVLQCALFCSLGNSIEISAMTTGGTSLSYRAVTNPARHFMGLHKSKFIVLQLCSLFIIDSFGGSFVLQSVVSAWFYKTYGTASDKLGLIVFVCNLVAGVSALFAAKLADHIGLVMTMVVTHLPSSVLLVVLPLMPSEALAIFILCLRASVSQMDVPTRTAYVQSVVDPDEQSAANGVTAVVRSIGASIGPYFAGLLYADPKYRNYPFFIAGFLKILYDLLLLYSFSTVNSAHNVKKVSSLADIDDCGDDCGADYCADIGCANSDDSIELLLVPINTVQCDKKLLIS